jgi:hypothetical protein
MGFAVAPFRVFIARLSVAIFVGFCCQSASGGLCSPGPGEGARHEFQFLAGYSPASTTLVGKTENRQFVQAGFAYGYRCWRTGWLHVNPTATILPLAMMFQPESTVADREIRPHAIYGVGVLPLGFTFDVQPAARIGMFGETHGGIIASVEPIPVHAVDATDLNFLFDFGGGVRWRPTDSHMFRMGYRLVHISNGGATPFNPGLDNNLLYASVSILR